MNAKTVTDADPWTDINFEDPELQRLLDEPLNLDNSVLRIDEHFCGFDNNVGDTWIYPSNMPLRCYQYNITHNALYRNTLVVLPTGLGKTFIAAVVMYNLYRWYPTGKVIFMAPTRPLVAQQIEACQKIMPFPDEDTVELTGKLNKKVRMELWQSKRVFFATPQVVQSDIASIEEPGEESSFPFAQVKLLVFDEAHKAKGRYAYTEVSQTLWRHNRYFRVLALSATPGRTMEDVAHVVRNLFISHLEVRCDTSIDVCPYVHKRSMSTVVVQLSAEMQALRDELLSIIDPYLRQLIDADVLSGSLTNINRNWLLYEQKRFRERSMNQRHPLQSVVTSNFSVCISLYHAVDLLERHGMRVFLNNFENDEDGRAKFVVAMDRRLRDLIEKVRRQVGPNPFDVSANAMTNGQIAQIPADLDFGHPKFDKARSCMLEHFQSNPESRAIVFCEYRESVMLIYRLLLQHRPLLKPRCFVGQGGSTGSLRAVSQKQQIQIMSDFRTGVSNVLIATSIGEEGIDVGEVDLIVCFDISTTNPTRFIQRIGRTGRQKQGAVVMLVTAGKEQALLKDVLSNKDQTNKKLSRSTVVAGALYKSAPRMVPSEFNPQCLKTYVKPPEAKPIIKKTKSAAVKVKKSAKSSALAGSQDLRKFFKKPSVALDPADLEVFALDDNKKKSTQSVGLSTQITLERSLSKVDTYFEGLDVSNILSARTQTQKVSDPAVVTVSKDSQNLGRFLKRPSNQLESKNLEVAKKKSAVLNSEVATTSRGIVKKSAEQKMPSNQNVSTVEDYQQEQTVSPGFGLPKLLEENLKKISKFYEELGISYKDPTADNDGNESDEGYLQRIDEFSDTNSETSIEKPVPLSLSEFIEQLKLPELRRSSKQKILQKNLKFVRESVDKMKALLRWRDDSSDSSDDDSSLPSHAAEIRSNYQLLVSIMESEQALKQFLEDMELKKFNSKSLDAEEDIFDKEDYDNIFGHVEEHNFDSDDYKSKFEQYKKLEEIKAKTKEEETTRQTVAESMVYDTMRLSSEDISSMQYDAAALSHEDFSITESKYCSQWDEFANQEMKHISTPLQAGPSKNPLKKSIANTNSRKTCNLLEVFQANQESVDDDDVVFFEQQKDNFPKSSAAVTQASPQIEKATSSKSLIDDITPDDLPLPVVHTIEPKFEPLQEKSPSNVAVEQLPNGFEASNTESMLNELELNLDAFLEPFPEEKILTEQVSKMALNSTTTQAPSRRNSLKENLLQPPAIQTPPRVSPDLFDFEQEPSPKKAKNLTKRNGPAEETKQQIKSSDAKEPKQPLASLAAKALRNSVESHNRSPITTPKKVETPAPTSTTSKPPDNLLTKSYEKSPSLFDIYIRNSRRLSRRQELSATMSNSLRNDSVQHSAPAPAPADETLIVRKPSGTSKRKIFDSDSEEDEKEGKQKTKDLTAIEITDMETSSEEIAPSQQKTSAQHRKKRRRLNCSFVQQEAAVSGSDVSADEADYTLGHFVYDSVVVPSDEAEDDAPTSNMQGIYLQSLKSPANRRGAFKIPAFKVYNDHAKIFSQALPVESSQYITNSFVVDEEDVSINVEQSICPLERAERILKERKRAKRKYAQIARTTTRKKNKKICLTSDSSDDDDDDFEQ